LKQLGHFPLLHFISGKYDDFLGIVPFQGHWNELVAKGASAAGDEDGGIFEHSHFLWVLL
jgi:hypothetical protein